MAGNLKLNQILSVGENASSVTALHLNQMLEISLSNIYRRGDLIKTLDQTKCVEAMIRNFSLNASHNFSFYQIPYMELLRLFFTQDLIFGYDLRSEN